MSTKDWYKLCSLLIWIVVVLNKLCKCWIENSSRNFFSVFQNITTKMGNKKLWKSNYESFFDYLNLIHLQVLEIRSIYYLFFKPHGGTLVTLNFWFSFSVKLSSMKHSSQFTFWMMFDLAHAKVEKFMSCSSDKIYEFHETLNFCVT